jgi:Flp pilus assembly protein TadD
VTTQRLIADAAAAFERRDAASAERDCRAVLTVEPDNPDAMHLLGLVRRQLGDGAGAEPLLRRSIELCPARAEFRVNLSNLLVAAGRLDEARAELRRALAAEPQSRAARLALARLLVRIG